MKKLETSIYIMVLSISRRLELFRRDSQVWQTDGRTDILAANAALNFTAGKNTTKRCARKRSRWAMLQHSSFLPHNDKTRQWMHYVRLKSDISDRFSIYRARPNINLTIIGLK